MIFLRLIDNSEILYVEPNKERTHNWLSVSRLKLPLPSSNYGFINTIMPPKAESVNNNSMQNQQNNTEIKKSIKMLDADYLKSVESNDLETAQKLVDTRYARKMGKSVDSGKKKKYNKHSYSGSKNAMYEDVKLEYEKANRKSENTFYEHSNKIRTDRNGSLRNSFESQNRGYADRDVGQTGSEGLQGDSERSNEHLRTGDNRKSIKLYPDAKKILDSNPELKPVLNIFSHSLNLQEIIFRVNSS